MFGNAVISVTGDDILDKMIREQPRIAAQALNEATLEGQKFITDRFMAAGLTPETMIRRVTMKKATFNRLVSILLYKVSAVRLHALQEVDATTINAFGSSPQNLPFEATVPASRFGKRPSVKGVFARETSKRLKIDMLYRSMDNVITEADRDAMINVVVTSFRTKATERLNAL